MSVYTILEPSQASSAPANSAQAIRFLKEGFSLFALLVPPLWLIANRLWLALIIYLAMLLAIETALDAYAVPLEIRLAVEAGLSLLIGLEAVNIRRLTLERAGWREVGAVVAANIDEAEARFFVPWSEHLPEGAPAAGPAIAAPVSAQVIGLFPRTGGRA